MLVLSRNIHETIIIGRQAEIKVTVLEIRGNQVRLGIDAPRVIPINRAERPGAIMNTGGS